MKLAVFGPAAREVAGGAGIAVIDAAEKAGEKWGSMLVDAGADGAPEIAGDALAAGQRVMVVDARSAAGSAWRTLATARNSRLTVSRPLLAAPLVARTIEVVGAGTIGAPRTLDLTWTVAGGEDVTTVACDLIDVACTLLDSEPVSLYGVTCAVDGPPLIKINVLTETGAIATIEVVGETDVLSARSDLYLFGTDGEIDHRQSRVNALWSDGQRRSLPATPSIAELRAREVAAWFHNQETGHESRDGSALDRHLAVAHALAQSLATGEMVDTREAG